MAKYYTPSNHEIRALRSRLEMSQPEMAELLMCSPATISKWEQGVNTMPPMCWHAAQIIVAKAEEDKQPTQERLTVYDKKKADREAEEQKKLEAQERYQRRLMELRLEEEAKFEAFNEHFEDLKDRIGKFYAKVHTDPQFENLDTSADVGRAILLVEQMYRSNKDRIEALNPDKPPYRYLAQVYPQYVVS